MTEQTNKKPAQTPPRRGGGPGQMMPGEKPKEFKKTLKRLAHYLKPRKIQLILVALAAFLSTVFNVISPKLLGDATTSLFESFMSGTGVDFTYIGNLLLMLLGLYVVSSLFMFVQHFIMASV